MIDPSWAATGSLNTARRDQTATLLPSGKVLVAGGYNGSFLSSAELYDPASGMWSATGSLSGARYYQGDAAAQRQGAGGGRTGYRWALAQRGTLRSWDWAVDGDRQPGRRTP